MGNNLPTQVNCVRSQTNPGAAHSAPPAVQAIGSTRENEYIGKYEDV